LGVVNDGPCARHKKKSTEVEETYVNDRTVVEYKTAKQERQTVATDRRLQGKSNVSQKTA